MALTPPALDRDRFCTVESIRPDPSGTALVRFSGIHGIGAAQGIAGCRVLAARDDLDLGPLDAAYDDLIDREVVDGRYGPLGRITEIIETPANDVWCVEGPYGEVLVPVVEAALDAIPDDGPIRTHIMDGLIDLEGDGEGGTDGIGAADPDGSNGSAVNAASPAAGPDGAADPGSDAVPGEALP